jgi:hypothetical protein
MKEKHLVIEHEILRERFKIGDKNVIIEKRIVGWLIVYYMETSPLPVKDWKFRPMLGAQGL